MPSGLVLVKVFLPHYIETRTARRRCTLMWCVWLAWLIAALQGKFSDIVTGTYLSHYSDMHPMSVVSSRIRVKKIITNNNVFTITPISPLQSSCSSPSSESHAILFKTFPHVMFLVVMPDMKELFSDTGPCSVIMDICVLHQKDQSDTGCVRDQWPFHSTAELIKGSVPET